MSPSDKPNSEQLDLYEVAQQMAVVTQHLMEAMDEESHNSRESTDNLESHLKEAEKAQEKRRMELEAKRERIKREFAAKWKRN